MHGVLGFTEVIPALSHRVQLLQHITAIYPFEKPGSHDDTLQALYVVATKTGILYCVRIRFTDELVRAWKAYLQIVQEHCCDWKAFDRTALAKDWGRAGSYQAVCQMSSLREALRQFVIDTGEPLGDAKYLKPWAVCIWNVIKTAVDTTSRMIKNTEIYQEQEANPQVYILKKDVKSIFLNSYHMTQVVLCIGEY